MKHIFLILTLISSFVFAAGVEQKWPTDTARLGIASSTASRVFTFDTGEGALSPKITIPFATKDFNFNKAVKIANNLLRVGDGANVITKVIEFDLGLGALNPKMNFNAVTGAFEFEQGTFNAKGNLLSLGDGLNSIKTIKFNKGVSSPEIRYNSTSAKLEFSNDGAVYKVIGSGSGGSGGTNLLENDGFEDGVISGWLASGLTVQEGLYSTPTTNNIKFASMTATVSGSYYESSSYNVTDVLNGQDCEFNSKYQSLTGSWRAEVFVSGSVVVSQTLSNNTNWADAPKMFFPCGQLGTTQTKVRFTNLVSGTLAIDDVYLGSLRSAKTGAVTTSCIPYTPTTAGFGVITVADFCYIQIGDNIIVKGRFTAGTTAGVTASVGLPNGFVISTAKVPNARPSGFGSRSVANANSTNSIIIVGGNSNLAFSSSIVSAANNPFAPANANAFLGTGEVFSFETGVIPIQGLSGSSTTIDSVCPNDIACENTFSLKVAQTTGNVSDESLDFVNGNCVVGGGGGQLTTCQFNPNIFTVAPNCVISGAGVAGTTVGLTSSSSSTAFVIRGFGTTTGNAGSQDVHVVCHKQGADYKANKTLRASFGKVVGSSGLFNERMVRVKVATTCTASPCTITNQSGDVLNVVRNSTGNYTVNFLAGTFIQPPTCHIQAYLAANAIGSSNNTNMNITSGTLTFSTGNTSSGAQLDTQFDVTCHGPQ